ncbi:hypothetical protein BRADI_4g03185v3, partial [Brachypodium distachyon]
GTAALFPPPAATLPPHNRTPFLPRPAATPPPRPPPHAINAAAHRVRRGLRPRSTSQPPPTLVVPPRRCGEDDGSPDENRDSGVGYFFFPNSGVGYTAIPSTAPALSPPPFSLRRGRRAAPCRAWARPMPVVATDRTPPAFQRRQSSLGPSFIYCCIGLDRVVLDRLLVAGLWPM